MANNQITVSVDPDVAEAYRAASTEQQRKLDLLINLKLRDGLRSSPSLAQLMSDISQKAQERGLTPEILKSILEQ